MKYPYTIEYFMIGTDRQPVMALPKEIELVTGFLLTEIRQPLEKNNFMQGISLVLQDKVSYWVVGGNVYKLEIRKDFTRVVDTLAEEETTCSIETEELKQLMEVWVAITKEKS